MNTVPDNQLTEFQKELRQELQRFVTDEINSLDYNDYEWREKPEDRVPWEIIDKANHELGLVGLTIPEEYGGLAASPLTLTVAAEELGAGDMGIAVIFDQTWRAVRMVGQLGDHELRDEFFSDLLDDSGHMLAIIANEPVTASGYGSPNDTQPDLVAAKEGGDWIITGEKRAVPNGLDAKTFVILPETTNDTESGIAFLVPRDTPGIEVTHVHEKISQRLVNHATVKLNDVHVSEPMILGKEDRGMSAVNEVLLEGNLVSAATTLGTARVALEEAFRYAHDRVQGGTEIINHQSIAHQFAEMAIQLQAARALIWAGASSMENNDSVHKEITSMAKVFAADAAINVSRQSLEMFGGSGIMLDTAQQKYFRDTLSFLHSNGTQSIHKDRIIGVLRDRFE